MHNPYLPYPLRIESVVTESEDRNQKTFKLVFLNPEDEVKFKYMPGQFAELSVAGQGEIPIGIASSPTEKGFIMFTVNKVGKVSSHLHNMKEGDIMGVRGPLGNWYPWDTLEGKNLVIIGGGFAFTTLRSSIVYMLDPENRSRYGNIDVVYGARMPGLLLYKEELATWEQRDDINMHITVDGTTDPNWKYNVGFVPTVTKEKAPSAELGENQADAHTLPPYEVLDAIHARLVEQDATAAELAAEGFDPATVRKVARMLDAAEFKRRQAAPGVKVTGRSFGRDRRYPITNRFRDPL